MDPLQHRWQHADDDALDALLAASAPPVATGDGVEVEVRDLLLAVRDQQEAPRATPADAALAARSSRGAARRRRLLVGAGAAVLALSGASVAAADPGFSDWLARTSGWTWSSAAEQAPGTCSVLGMDIQADGVPEDAPNAVAARAFVAGLEPSDIDPRAELARLGEQVVTVDSMDGSAPREVLGKDAFTPEELLSSAYDAAMWDLVTAHLAEQGLSVDGLGGVTGAQGCVAEGAR